MQERHIVAKIKEMFGENEILTASIISNLLFPKSNLKESKRLINRILYKYEGSLWYRIEGNKWTALSKLQPPNSEYWGLRCGNKGYFL